MTQAAIGFWQQQWQFTLKELRETLRDRRTIITLLAMPLLLYPLLGVGMRFLAVQQSPANAEEVRIALTTAEEAQWLKDALHEADRLFVGDKVAIAQTSDAEQQNGQPTERQVASEPKWFVPDDLDGFNLRESVEDADADVGVRVHTLSPPESGRVPITRVELLQRSGSPASQRAATYVQSRLNRLNLNTAVQVVKRIDPQFQLPLQDSIEIIATKTGGRGTAILGLLPLILLLMTVTGGVYPAIDLTAGERERETLETLMALPVPRHRLLLAKYAAVVTVTLLTGLMNLLAMTITVFALQLESTLFGGNGLTIGLALRLVMTLTAFAGFFSAVLLLLTSSARSFKEAQALLIPMLMVSLAPGLVIMLPGWHLSLTTAVVPVINMLLLARSLFEGSAPVLPSVVAIVSTMLYAAAALSLAAKLFGADAAAVGSRGRWSELFVRPKADESRLDLTLASFGLAVLFPLYFLASGLAARGTTMTMNVRLLLSGCLTMTLFAGWPLLLLTLRRISWRAALAWTSPRWMVLPAVVMIGLSTWPWVFEMVVGLQSLGLGQLDEEKRKLVEALLAGWKEIPLPLIVLTLGIVPGICEELFFRGFLFGGLRSRLSGPATIVLTAIAFGLFHVILNGGAAPERVAPSMCMGLLLGWIRWQTGSLMPSMIVHVIHNSLLLTVAHYQDHLQGWSLGAVEASHLPMPWLAGFGVCLAAGVLLLLFRGKDASAVV